VRAVSNGTGSGSGSPKEFLWRPGLARLAVHVVAAGLLAFLVLVFFYADRGAGIEGYIRPPAAAAAGDTGLYEALGQPLSFPGYALDTVEHAFWEAVGRWGSVSSGGEDTSFIERYITTLGVELDAIRHSALAVSLLALLGMVWERYATRTPRNLIMFMSYCGLASLVGYSLKNDPGTGKWLTIHILLPLLFPAAVGASRLYRWGMEAYDEQDMVGFFIAVLVLVSLFSYTGVVAANTSYVDTTSEGNELVQFAQPEADSRAAFTALNAVSDGDGSDVMVYMGASHRARYGILGNDSYWYKEPTCIGTAWTSTLPLPWYFAEADTNVSCHSNSTTVSGELQADQPGMVITKPGDPTVPDQLLRENYSQRTFNLYRGAHPVRFWVHEDYTDEAPGWSDP
jgi:uncharacterized protein (TIGR03663 family)